MEKSDLSNRTKAVASSIAANCKLPVLFVSETLNSIIATDAATSIDRYMRSVFESAPTVYDKAMDAGRHVMKEYGPDHRLFDNFHSPLGAWSSVQDAVKDDSLRQEVAAFLRAYWKDVVTPMGMPVFTLDRSSFQNIVEFSDKFSVEASWLKDLASFTASEGAGALAAVIGASLAWRKSEIEEFSEHAAVIAGSAAVAANPLALTIAIILIARSVHVGRQESVLGKVMTNFGWGMAKTGAFVGASALVGGGVWIGVVSGIAASLLVAKLKNRCTDAPENYDPEFVSSRINGLIHQETMLLLENKT
ncbi:hypothetical protein N9L08_08565 [Rhodobacteraceae bacterium]|nr:hypothetical protein [Paracoccaceae bacterium]